MKQTRSQKRRAIAAVKAICSGAEFTNPAGAYMNNGGRVIARVQAIVPVTAYRNLSPKSGFNSRRVG